MNWEENPFQVLPSDNGHLVTRGEGTTETGGCAQRFHSCVCALPPGQEQRDLGWSERPVLHSLEQAAASQSALRRAPTCSHTAFTDPQRNPPTCSEKHYSLFSFAWTLVFTNDCETTKINMIILPGLGCLALSLSSQNIPERSS